jgi:4-amino-4-deoxy-L-arabinose transferase-like glycosyltransferase
MSRRKPLTPESPPLSPLPPKPVPIPTQWFVVLALVLVGYLCLGALHINTTPIAPDTNTNYINAPDEAAHLMYVRAIAEKGHIPVQHDKDYPTYEWHQPPLYYSLVSLVFPGGPKAVRWATLFLGLVGVWVVFLASRRVFPDDPALAVTAAGFMALIPMRQATTSAVGNDVMIELLFSATFLVIARIFHGGYTIARAITLGACIGLALATKANGILLLPLLAVAAFCFRAVGESWKTIGRGFIWTLLVALLLPAGWYARNYRLYREITPVRAFVREFANTATADQFIGKRRFTADLWTGEMVPADDITRSQYLGLLANWTYRTFWAAYTPRGTAATLGIPFFLPPPFYLLGTFLILPAFGGLWKLHVRRKDVFTSSQIQFIRLCSVALLLVSLSFLGFTWTFFQAQGRYLYPAMLPISLLWAAGFRGILPERYRDAGTLAALAILLLLSLAFILVGILPAYSPPS